MNPLPLEDRINMQLWHTLQEPLHKGTAAKTWTSTEVAGGKKSHRRGSAVKRPVLEDTESEGDQGATNEDDFENQPVLCLAEPAMREDGQKPTPFADRTNSKVRPLQAR